MEIEELNLEKVKELAQLEIAISQLEDSISDSKIEVKQLKVKRKNVVEDLIRIGTGQLQIDDYTDRGEEAVPDMASEALLQIITDKIEEDTSKNLPILEAYLKKVEIDGKENMTVQMAREVLLEMGHVFPTFEMKEILEGDSITCEYCEEEIHGAGSYHAHTDEQGFISAFCSQEHGELQIAKDNEEDAEKTPMTNIATELTKGSASSEGFKLALMAASVTDIRVALKETYGQVGHKGRGEALIAQAATRGWAQPHENCDGTLILKIDNEWTCIDCQAAVTIEEAKEEEPNGSD